MSTLFNGDSDSDGELKINNNYATNYNNWRQKEELNKLKTKYGDINDKSGTSDEGSDDDSSSEEEVENELTEQFDKDFYKTLACLKNKDPRIYDKDASFFNDTNKVQETHNEKKQKLDKKSKKEETVFLRDYERKLIVEREGKLSDSEDEDVLKKKAKADNNITYMEEQQQLKDSFKQALLDEDQADDAELLKPKSKSESDQQKEEADYKEWLKGQELEIDEKEKEELKPLRDFWSNPNLDGNEKFLRDYILNNKYRDNEYSGIDLDYEHTAHDSDDNLSEDEKNIEKQEEFEHKYNFRFEEPDQEFIKRYPRTMENSLRKKDTRRAQKRAEVKQRKADDKLRKKEELLQLKALKRKEIEDKIEKLKEITGNDDIEFNGIDLDGDFDPLEHDRKMTEIFNEDYYAHADADEDTKPEFPDIDEELEIEKTWDNYDPHTDNLGADDYDQNEPHCEDPNFNMDADYDELKSAQLEEMTSTKKRKRGRRSKFAELIAKEKPKFDPNQYRSYEEYFDKYYSLDYEDMIGDIPCRFKYRKVVPNDYGLSVEEILMADDKELNKWCSLKKALQYKPEHLELNDVHMYKQKARNEEVKKKVLRSLYTTPEEEESINNTENAGSSSMANGENIETKKKRHRNKKKNKAKNTDNITIENGHKVLTTDNKNEKVMRDDTIIQPKNDTKDSQIKKRKKKLSEHFEQSVKKKLKVENSEMTNSSTEITSNLEKKAIENDERATHIKSNSSKDTKKKNKSKKFEKNRKKGSKHKEGDNNHRDIMSLNPERLKTYGINPKKLKNKLKYGNK